MSIQKWCISLEFKAGDKSKKDVEGREYIDFAGGIAVMNVGHSHPKVVAAIKKQAEKFTHTSFMVNPFDAAVRLAEKLAAIPPGDFSKKTLFVNSGWRRVRIT